MLELARLQHMENVANRPESESDWTTREILRHVIGHLCTIHPDNPDNAKKGVESFDEAPSLRFRLEEVRSQRDAAQARVKELEAERVKNCKKRFFGKIVVKESSSDTDFNVWAGDLLAWEGTEHEASAMARCIRLWAGISEE